MISIGDLVEWTEMSTVSARRTKEPDFPVLGIVFRTKTSSLDGINETEILKVHFPDRQQYWIARDCLSKIAQLRTLKKT